MKLMVFDLDTALCQTSTMDGLAMASAIYDVTECHIQPETIGQISDLKALWYQAAGTLPSGDDLKSLRDRFSFHLRRQFIIRPSVVEANYPMVEAVNRLQSRSDTVVGLVSTSSASVLVLKARAIGLMSETIPVATGDDADHFDGILKSMKVRVMRSFGCFYDQAELIGGIDWHIAAQRQKMQHTLPQDFITEHVVPAHTNLFRRAGVSA